MGRRGWSIHTSLSHMLVLFHVSVRPPPVCLCTPAGDNGDGTQPASNSLHSPGPEPVKRCSLVRPRQWSAGFTTGPRARRVHGIGSAMASPRGPARLASALLALLTPRKIGGLWRRECSATLRGQWHGASRRGQCVARDGPAWQGRAGRAGNTRHDDSVGSCLGAIAMAKATRRNGAAQAGRRSACATLLRAGR